MTNDETFPTQIHKLTVLIVDHDELGADEVKQVLENQRYPNHCLGPHVMQMETREVEWNDDHPLNRGDTQAETFGKMFPSSDATELAALVAAIDSERGFGHGLTPLGAVQSMGERYRELLRHFHCSQSDWMAAENEAKELRLALQAVLNSASPNERDHPSMSLAWKNAQVVLDAKDPR